MTHRQTIDFALQALLDAGADKAKCSLSYSEKHELNTHAGTIDLFRTTYNISLSLVALKEGKKGSMAINKIDEQSIRDAAAQVLTMAESSQPDAANDISEMQPEAHFEHGPTQPDRQLMFRRLEEFLAWSAQKYPHTILEEGTLSYTSSTSWLGNSNSVRYSSRHGAYDFSIMFTSKDNGNTSSFNYTYFQDVDLPKPLHEYDEVDTLLGQSAGQVTTQPLPQSFNGTVIFTPQAMGTVVGTTMRFLSDVPLITGTSLYKDKLDTQIADPRLNIYCHPHSKLLPAGADFTSDGYCTKDMTLIEAGVLRSFLLSMYGARKTGLQRAANMGSNLIVDSGDTPLAEMIAAVDEGLLLCRFSGGNPSDNGDFSGVAKNSYYIKDGKIQFPVSETMVSGNIASMLNSIESISAERVNNGYNVMPWICFNGLNVTGK
jgi:PmbA protein